MGDINSVEYYLANPSFRKWVKNPSPELDQYWKTWMSSHKETHRFIHEAKELMVSVKYRDYLLDQPDKTNLRERIDHEISRAVNSKKHKRNIGTNIYYYIKVAAVLLILMMSVYIMYQFAITDQGKMAVPAVKSIVKSTTSGEKLTVKLQDGTLVKLNSGSWISYPEQFNIQERTIELHGEAYFDVAKDPARAFIVNAGHLYIKALGTTFNVTNFAGEDSIFVSLTSGNVLVGSQDLDSLLLKPGQTASYSVEKNTLVKHDFLNKQAVSWMDDIIVFKKADWNEIKKKLERWYGVQMINERPDIQWEYSGEFKGYSLQNILKSMCYSKNLNFNIEKDKVRIY